MNLRFGIEAPPASRRTDERLVCAAGIFYVAGIVWREHLMAALGVPYPLTSEYILAHGTRYVVALALPIVPTALILVWALSRDQGASLRAFVRPAQQPNLLAASIVTCAVSFVLNGIGLWPFDWRWATNASSQVARYLVQSGQILAILLWLAFLTVVVPVVEELVFRYGVLQFLRRKLHSDTLAILATSILFAIGHLGRPMWRPDTEHVVNTSWIFVFSLMLGSATLRRDGSIVFAITVHASRNMLVGLVLLADVMPS